MSMRPRSSRVVLGGLAVLASLAANGASAGLFDDDEARRQIVVERKRIDDLSNRANVQAQATEAGIKAINDRLGRMEESLKGQGLLDLFREIEILKAELARMRGQMEVIANSVEVNQKRQRDFYVDLDTRLRRIEAPSATGAPGPAAAVDAQPGQAPAATSPSSVSASASSRAPAAAAPAAVPAAVPADSAEARVYDNAQNMRRIGNYQGAIAAFQEFIKRYPKSTLASSAQYWIGDSYFNLRDFRLAIQSQRTLLGLYPDSHKVPDALLNIASSQMEMGESVAGRRTMEELVAKHPVSDAADKARRRLAASR